LPNGIVQHGTDTAGANLSQGESATFLRQHADHLETTTRASAHNGPISTTGAKEARLETPATDAGAAPSSASPNTGRITAPGETLFVATIDKSGSKLDLVRDNRVITSFNIASGNGSGYNDLSKQEKTGIGPTPEGYHPLSERGALFHGQRTLRLGNTGNRSGVLAHALKLLSAAPSQPGASQGCINVLGAHGEAGGKSDPAQQAEYRRFLNVYDQYHPKAMVVKGPATKITNGNPKL